ncbi:MAG: phage tail tape measure protein, partial [Pseudomonadales bacterium]
MANKNDDVIELIIEGKDEYSDVSAEVREELGKLADSTKETRAEFERLEQSLDLADTYRDQEKEVNRLAEAQARSKIEVDALNKSNRASKGANVELVASLAKAKAEFASLRTATNKAQKAFDSTQNSMRQYGIELSDIENNQATYRQSTEQLAAQLTELSLAQTNIVRQTRAEVSASQAQAAATQEQAAASKKLAEQLQQEQTRQQAITAQQIETAGQSRQYTLAIGEMTTALREGNITLEQYRIRTAQAADASTLSRAEIGRINRALEEQVITARDAAAAQARIATQSARSAAESARLATATGQYRTELERLVAEYRSGAINSTAFGRAERELRQDLSLTEQQVRETRREFAAYTDSMQVSVASHDAAGESTNRLARVTRHLATAYAVMITAQEAAQAAGSGYEQYTQTENAMLGLAKTTGLTATELNDLSSEMEHLSSDVTPTTKAELLGVAESAGRMGVQGAENIQAFTKSIDALASATDLLGEDGATAIARILNITGEAQENVAGVASSIAGLGNVTAASESEIAKFALRLASSTAEAKLSAAEVLGISAGMAEMGIQAEGASTVIGRVFRIMTDAVATGGEEMKQFSEVTGLSGEAVSKAFGEDKVALFGDFINGINRMQSEGTTLNQTLADMGISSDENARILGILSTRYEGVADAVKVSNESFEKGNVHFKEAAKQAAALSSSYDRLANKAKVLQERMGEAFSDDLFVLMKDLGLSAENVEGDFADLGETLADVVQGTVSLIKTVGGLDELFGGIIGSSSLFSTALLIVNTTLSTVVQAVNMAIAGFSQLGITWNKFFGDTDDVEEWRKIQENAFDRVAE